VSNVGYISCTRKPTQPLDYNEKCGECEQEWVSF